MTKRPPRRRGMVLTTVLMCAALMLASCGGDDDDAPAATSTPASTGASATATTSTAENPSPAAEDGTRQIEADNGTIEIPANPQRVATIGNTTLPFIDLGGKPVGVTAESDSDIERLPADQQATYAAATILAASADEVDMEQLASLEPDLILVQVPGAEFELIAKELETIAPTVFFGLDKEWKELADGIAEAGNLTDGLDEQKAEFEEKVATIQETYREIIDNASFVDVIRWSSSDPGTFAIADIGCSEIARDEVGMNLPEAAEGENPLAWTDLSFEQIGELDKYDVITYPVDAEGQPTEPFAPVVETNSWKALPAVQSGRALGIFCSGNNSYGSVLRYLDSLDAALATLPADVVSTDAPDTTGETRMVEADNGTVEVPANPQRIATLGRATGSFLALDGEPIAVTELSAGNFDALLEHQQAAYEAATNLGASGSEADLEQLASLEPDLIFISVPDSDFDQMKDQLEAIAPTILLSFQSDWEQRVAVLAEAGNKMDVLDQQKADFTEQVADIKAEYADLIANTTFVEVSRGANSDPAVFTLNGSVCTEVVRAEVGLNITDLGEGGESRSYEQIGELADYHVILYPVDHEGNVTEAFLPMTETNAWQALPAVQAGRTVGVYCPQDRSYLGNTQYMQSLERGLAALPKDD